MFVKTALINGYQQRVFHGSHLAYEAPEIMRMSVWVCKRGCYSDGLDPCLPLYAAAFHHCFTTELRGGVDIFCQIRILRKEKVFRTALLTLKPTGLKIGHQGQDN
jgi:hypothetical protein